VWFIIFGDIKKLEMKGCPKRPKRSHVEFIETSHILTIDSSTSSE